MNDLENNEHEQIEIGINNKEDVEEVINQQITFEDSIHTSTVLQDDQEKTNIECSNPSHEIQNEVINEDITEVIQINDLERYIPIKKLEKAKTQEEEITFLKKKSKLEIEKEKAKNIKIDNNENICSNKIKELKTNEFGSLDDCFIKRKSKLEIEKEKFANLMSKMKEEQRIKNTKKYNNEEDTVLKIESSIKLPEEKILIENKMINKIPSNICEICKLEGILTKGKLFPKCKHYYHSVSRNLYYIIIRNAY